MAERKFESFEEFWPYYLREHRDPTNRTLHALGTFAACATAGYALAARKPKFLALAPLLGYGSAWIGHFLIEKNRPATFDYPAWSLMGDLKMAKMMAAGELDEELRRLNLDEKWRELPA